MSRELLFLNNRRSTLAVAILPADTTIQVADPVFPVVGSDETYMLTLEEVGGTNVEIVKAVSGGPTNIVVERAQENTTALAFNVGDLVDARTTAGGLARLGQKSEVGASFTYQTTAVTSAITLYVDPTGDDTTGDGSLSAPWATPEKALSEIQFLRFGPNGSCDIQIAAGTYVMSNPLVLDHPQGDKVTLTGDSGTFQSLTGMPIGDYSIDRNLPTVPPKGTNELFNTAGTLGQNANASSRTTARGTDSTNNLGQMRTNAGTILEWSFVAADDSFPKFDIKTAVGQISNIQFIFPPSGGNGNHGITVRSNARVTIVDTNIHGGHAGIFLGASAALQATNVSIANSYTGVTGRYNSAARFELLHVQGCETVGMDLQDGVEISVDDLIVSGCGGEGVSLSRSSGIQGEGASPWVVSGNGSTNVSIVNNSSFSNNVGVITTSGSASFGVLSGQGYISALGLQSIGNSSGIFSINGSLITVGAGPNDLRNNVNDGIIAERYAVYTAGGALTIVNNGRDAINLDSGAGFIAKGTLTITGNARHVFTAEYAGKCELGTLICDLTNLTSPHLRAVGGVTTKSIAPGSGGVDAGIVYSPPFNTTSAPDSTVFTDLSF